MNNNKRGVYGPDDVNWDTQAARNAEADELYRKNKEEIDARDRLSAKTSLLYAHESDGAIYQDGDHVLHIGYERNGRIVTFGTVDIQKQLITFAPISVATRHMVKWTPFSQVFNQITNFDRIAPKGCI